MKKAVKILSFAIILILMLNSIGVSVFALESSENDFDALNDEGSRTAVSQGTGFLLKNGGYIVLESPEDKRLIAAGEALSDYLGKVTGEEFKIADNGDGIKFTVGYSLNAANNGYIIETGENEVSIKGNGTQGVIRGVFAFLEKYCECNWFTSGLYEIPQNTDIIIPTEEKTEYKPYFEYTDTDWVSPRDVTYSLANGLNGSPYRAIPDELGGTVEYITNFAHTLGAQFCSREIYYKSNPEYFALHNGIRQNEQLCLTNEDVYKLVLSEVMALLKEKHNPEKSLQIISLTQGDSTEDAKMCQCKNCKAIDEENGAYSGSLLTFVNRIAREVKKAGYNNVAIDTFAYRYTRKVPQLVVPESNVIVRLCTIECCFAHALDDENCSENVDFMADLNAWSEICDRIYIWDYTTNYAHTVGVFPDFGVLQRNIQVFYENNVVGVYEEGNYYMEMCDAEFGELRSYLLSKLMQNPYIDYSLYMNKFLEAYYGAGWESIREFIDMTIEKPVADGEHLSIYNTMSNTLGFTKEDVEKADLLWQQAKDEAEGGQQLKNIERSEISWRYWKGFNCYNKEENKRLLADIKALGITMMAEGDVNGPDSFVFANESANKIGEDLFSVAVALYIIVIALSVAVVVIALKNRPQKFIYILLLILIGVFFEIFGWHKRAYLGGVDAFGYWLTLALMPLLYAFAGALMTSGKKQRLVSALAAFGGWWALYGFAFIAVNGVIFDGGAKTLGITLAYILIGIEAVIIILRTALNFLKNKKRNK